MMLRGGEMSRRIRRRRRHFSLNNSSQKPKSKRRPIGQNFFLGKRETRFIFEKIIVYLKFRLFEKKKEMN